MKKTVYSILALFWASFMWFISLNTYAAEEINPNEIYADKIMSKLEVKVVEMAPIFQEQQDLWLKFIIAVDSYIVKKKKSNQVVHPAVSYLQVKLQLKFLGELEMADTEQVNEVLRLVNVEREKLWIGPVKLNILLSKAAAWHWQYLSDWTHFSHNQDIWNWECVEEELAFEAAARNWLSKNELLSWSEVLDSKCVILTERVLDVGYEYEFVGENIAMWQKSAAKVMADWMNSPAHRDNIINADYKELGVWYSTRRHAWVQNFWTEFPEWVESWE